MIYEDNHLGFWENPPAPDPNVSNDPEIVKLDTDINNLGGGPLNWEINQFAFAVKTSQMPDGKWFCVDSQTKGKGYDADPDIIIGLSCP